MSLLLEALPELIATLIGVSVGGFGALCMGRINERRHKRRRARLLLLNIAQELMDNHGALKQAHPVYQQTPHGKSFHISTIAWETAVATGDLHENLGMELAEMIESQYAVLFRLRYYVDLMTKLWFAPSDIPGYESIRDGLRRNILQALDKALSFHPKILAYMEIAEEYIDVQGLPGEASFG